MMIALAILFGLTIFMNGSSFAAIHGRWAQQLELPGSIIIPYIPWVALGFYAIAVCTIKRIPTLWKRWTLFVAVTIVMNLVIVYPILVLKRGSVRIQIDDFLTRESQATLKANYPIKWVSYSGGGEGTCVLVRRTDYSDELARFVSNLETRKAEQGGTGQPATRPLSVSEGSDKPQPEAEGRSR
jgi:hypothetical protein